MRGSVKCLLEIEGKNTERMTSWFGISDVSIGSEHVISRRHARVVHGEADY